MPAFNTPTLTLEDILDGQGIRDFKPVAYYDKHMDCMRIELRDCSMTEERISPNITVLTDNYPGPGQDGHAGLMIKGVRHLFKEWNLALEGVHLVTEILNLLLDTLPQDWENIRPIQKVATQIELTVDMNEDHEMEALAA